MVVWNKGMLNPNNSWFYSSFIQIYLRRGSLYVLSSLNKFDYLMGKINIVKKKLYII